MIKIPVSVILSALFFCTLAGCLSSKPRQELTAEMANSIEATTQFLKITAEDRDWGMFYDALHPEIQDMINRKKFILGMKTHGKFARMIRHAEFRNSTSRGDFGRAIIAYKGHDYGIEFRKDDFGWKVYMDGEDIEALEKQIVANQER